MRLHQFIAAARDEILGYATRKLKERAPNRSATELTEALPEFLEEVFRALRLDAGEPDEHPLPRTSGAASRHGRQRHQQGFDITFAIEGFGCVCDAIMGVAAQKKLTFTAREFQVLNHAIDSAVATALLEYCELERAQRHQEHTQQFGAFVHELRNALSSATMAFSVIRSGQAGPASHTGDMLQRNLARMEAIIGQAVAAVQLDASLAVQRENLALEPFLREIAAAAVPERDIVLHLEADCGLEIEADRRLLSSAVTNLLQNALKFTRPGGTVAVRSYTSGDDAVIEVEDECGGLPPGREEEIFAPFVQQSSDKRGLGLGLPITRRAMEAQGGAVRVRNLPDRGCVFALMLPRAPVSAPR